MSEFKYACPVCGQHIKCDSSQSGSTMECPTCFQKITVPQAPATNDPKFIITGTKPGEVVLPSIPTERRREVSAERNLPLAVLVVLVILLALFGAGVMLMMQLRGKSSKPANAPAQATTVNNENRPIASTPPEPAPSSPAAYLDNTNWTLDLGPATMPDSAAAGYVHGKVLIPQRVVLDGGTLTLRTPNPGPPDAGVSIYLHAIQSKDLAGQSVDIKTNAVNAPWVNLRWKDAQGQPVTQTVKAGYALRIEFGQLAGNQLPGKICLCTPDETKSYLIGAFNAEILNPK
jgi:DNA-directed RNA polymerase subunit RPC12/RpoP